MTYAELEAKLQAWLEDDDAEFQGSIPDIIDLGQMRLWRDLDLSIFSSEQTAPTVISNASVTKPVTDTELVAFNSIYYTSGAKNNFLELRSTDFIRDHQVVGSTAPPKYYAEDTETTILLSPIPDQVYTLNFRGTTRLDPLDSDTPGDTNWLSLHQSDMLFKACLAEAEAFLKSDDRIPMWFEQYTGALPLAKKEVYQLLQARYQLMPLQVPASPTTQR
jgi:hypothetical protein